MKIRFFKSTKETNKIGEEESFLYETNSSVAPRIGEAVSFEDYFGAYRVIDSCYVCGEETYYEVLLFGEE